MLPASSQARPARVSVRTTIDRSRASSSRTRDRTARILSGAGGLAGYQTRPNVFTRNTAICARVFGLSGQYFRGEVLHPPVIPSP